MAPTDAVQLINWFPEANKLVMRKGHIEHATGVGSGEVPTLAQWRGPAGTKLIAAGGGEVYDASSTGAATVLTVSAAYTEDRWQTDNFNGRLFACNGLDAPWDYDGTTFTTTLWTGVTKADLINVSNFKGRLFFTEKNTGSAWYPATVGAVTGALVEFDFGQIAQHGGFLMATGSWSVDAGEGIDDRFVAVFSTGEVLVYGGSDPGVDFAKIGSYFGGEPIGRRCLVRLGGELIIITKAGPMPLSVLARDGTVDALDNHPVWGKDRESFVSDAALFSGSNGWEAIQEPSGKAMYFNIPSAVSTQQNQHVLNTISGSWTEYRGLNAHTWSMNDGELYFGGNDGKVYRHAGTTDDGNGIAFECRQAFNYFGERGRVKDFTAIRPLLSVTGTFVATIGIDVDFSDRNFPANNASFTGASTGSAWDEDDWDVAEWGAVPSPAQKWFTVQGCGYNASLRFSGSTSSQSVEWFSTNFMGTLGGIL